MPALRLRLFFQPPRQIFTECAVALEMPLAAHGVTLARATFRIEQHPYAATRRTRAFTVIVLCQSPRDVISPADISQMAIAREGAENIDVAVQCFVRVNVLKIVTGDR
jgi:hypothetical protein